MITTTETRSTERDLDALDLEAVLRAAAPIERDKIAEEVQAAHFEKRKGYQIALGGMAIGIVSLSIALGVVSNRPAQTRFIRLSPAGEAALSGPSDETYTPIPNDAKNYLRHWAQDYYTHLKGTIRTTLPESYLFFDAPLANDIQREDTKADKMAKILAGVAPENTVNVEQPRLLSFSPNHKIIKGRTYWGGYAVIDLTMTYPKGGFNGKPRLETYQVGIHFILNPDSAGEAEREDPKYGQINPLGLTILERPSENRVDVGNAK